MAPAVPVASVELAPPVRGKWVKLDHKGSGPGPRSAHTMALVGQKAYAFGGELTPRVPINNNLYVFDLKTLTWSLVEATGDIPPPRYGPTMSAVGETIYMFGGRDTAHSNDFLAFDTRTNEWTLLTNGDIGPSARSFHSVVSDDRTLYVFGGCGLSGRLNDFWAYDVVDKKWTELPSPGESCIPRGGLGLAIAQGKIWVVYGFSGMELDDVHCFDPVTKKWTKVETSGEKPAGRSVFSIVGIGKYIIIQGGEVVPSEKCHLEPGILTGDVYGLNVETLEWKKLDDGLGSKEHPGPRGWTAYAGGLHDGTEGLLVYGGKAPTNERFNDIFFFTPRF